MVAKGKWARGVSIIGVGQSKYGSVLEDPDLKGMTEKELLSWAVLEALKDAGVTPRDVDSVIVGSFMPETIRQKCIQTVANSWLGLDTKPGVSINAACGACVSGIRMAGSQIASGLDDIVVVSSTSILTSIVDEDLPRYVKQPAARKPIPIDLFSYYLFCGFDGGYFNPISGPGGIPVLAGIPALDYAKKYGLSPDQLDDALNGAAVSLRRGAVRHPKSAVYKQEEFKDLAKKNGFSDVMNYMKSNHFPYFDWPIRLSHYSLICDGAAALVLCATEDAKKYTTKPPIEVSGIGVAAGYIVGPHAPGWSAASPALEQHPMDESIKKQAYSMAGLDPSELDYVGMHDWSLHFHLWDPEILGYIPPGKAWQYLADGRTAFDGDKPMQTHGGECHFGNCFDPASVTDVIEAVQQMRGECGERQIQRTPKCAAVVGTGTGSIRGITVLRRKEGL